MVLLRCGCGARTGSALAFVLAVIVVFLAALLLGGSFRLFLGLAALLLFFSILALLVLHSLLAGFGFLAALLLLLGVAALLFLHLTLTGFGFGLTDPGKHDHFVRAETGAGR